MRRSKLKKRKSRKLFSRTAAKTNKRNAPKGIKRGGYRL